MFEIFENRREKGHKGAEGKAGSVCADADCTADLSGSPAVSNMRLYLVIVSGFTLISIFSCPV